MDMLRVGVSLELQILGLGSILQGDTAVLAVAHEGRCLRTNKLHDLRVDELAQEALPL